MEVMFFNDLRLVNNILIFYCVSIDRGMEFWGFFKIVFEWLVIFLI